MPQGAAGERWSGVRSRGAANHRRAGRARHRGAPPRRPGRATRRSPADAHCWAGRSSWSSPRAACGCTWPLHRARRGRAVAGVEIATLHGLAAGIVGRCEGPRRTGTRLLRCSSAVLPGVSRRSGAWLASLEDGELPVIATIRDLLDAGYTPANADAVGEHLEAEGRGRSGRVRRPWRGSPPRSPSCWRRGSRPRLRSAAAGDRLW